MGEPDNWQNLSLDRLRHRLFEEEEILTEEVLYRLQNDPRKGVQQLIKQYNYYLAKKEAEEIRLALMWEKEHSLRSNGYQFIAGLDEVGRGPLAGPVVAAAVILPDNCLFPGLNDSKKLSASQRLILTEQIKEKALAWSIGLVDHNEIDRINILQATKRAMVKAVEGLSLQPDYLLIDALEIPLSIAQEGIIQGDSRCRAIAAASIIAKTYRDNLMDKLDELYPYYGFKDNKGYGTPRHLEALAQYGPCLIHRKSFLK